jgi:hypothetical protein
MAALTSRTSSRPQEHRTVLTDKLIFSGKSCPQEEQVCDVLAGLTSTTILPASAALENSRSLKYPQLASMMLLDNLGSRGVSGMSLGAPRPINSTPPRATAVVARPCVGG